MTKQWFLIKSLGVTVDLSLVSHVVWNHKTDKCLYTGICLGTSVAYDPDTTSIEGNKWWVSDPADREDLQAALVALGLPTVELVFDRPRGRGFSRQEVVDE
ncbi:hypothetical protein QUA71_06885 [Microcoleus sp. MON1_C5]|uniref:hypothetical protein n=1 Tax=Microcoleus sp. MON1_C5 TaxID=2818828 RepID=UPI002FD2D57F